MQYKPERTNTKSGIDNFIAATRRNFDLLDQIDKAAKAEGSLLWRYISEPFADGRAYYQIVKVNKKTVRIVRCTGLGDDWTIPYWGNSATIDIDYAEQKISARDRLDAFFAK